MNILKIKLFKEKFKTKLLEIKKNIKEIISNEIFERETLFLIGVFIIVVTNFIVNLILGLYFLGILLIAYSIFLYKFRAKEVKKKK